MQAMMSTAFITCGTGGAAEVIAASGFDLQKGKRFKFGRGIYSTPDLAEAERYAKDFNWGGTSYRVIFQNRFVTYFNW